MRVMGSHGTYIMVMKKSIYAKYQQDIQGSVIKLGGSILFAIDSGLVSLFIQVLRFVMGFLRVPGW